MGIDMNRRQFLLSTGAGISALTLPYTSFGSTNNIPTFPLNASPGQTNLAGEGDKLTHVWQYNQSTPGPIIRIKQGMPVSIPFLNQLPEPTTVHWHGLRIANNMDGVPGLTQSVIKPGERFNYEFTPRDAGTFWYHPHNKTWEQMARGLYGVLIVEEKMPIEVDQDIVMVLDDWLLNDDYQIDEESLGSLHEWSHGGRLGNFLTVNGQSKPTFNTKKGERIRLRILNVANSRVMPLQISGTRATIIAIDGQPTEPAPLTNGQLVLAPSQRMDLILDMMQSPGESTHVQYRSRKRNIPIASLISHPKTVIREKPLSSPIALSPNPLPSKIPLSDAEHFELEMIGGAMGGMQGAIHKGEWKDTRVLIKEKLIWAMNGIAGLPKDPLFRVKRGSSVTIEMINKNRWPHAMHIHGHHFKTINNSGLIDPIWRDTILIDGSENKRVAFVADNPGKWLIHCHMLEHTAAGMITWFEVT